MATATDVLAGGEAVLTALYPGVPVRVRRGPPAAAGGKPDAGWQAGDPSTCFVLSLAAEDVEEQLSTFEEVLVKFPLRVDYVRPSPPASWKDDPDVREKRDAILAALYRPRLTGVAGVVHVGTRAGDPYQPVAGSTLSASVWYFDVVAWRARPAG